MDKLKHINITFYCVGEGEFEYAVRGKAAEGIGLRDGVETLIAKTPDQWIEAIEKLNYDPALWLNISKAGQEYVNTFYSFSAGEKLMAEALENVDIFI